MAIVEPRGYDAGKKIKGRKRHFLTDTEGNLVHAAIHTAEIVRLFPWLRHVFADDGYAGDKLKEALRRIGKWTVEIVKRSDTAKGFEQTIASATAWLFIASIQIFARRIARL
jgi:Transposase DDE domain